MVTSGALLFIVSSDILLVIRGFSSNETVKVQSWGFGLHKYFYVEMNCYKKPEDKTELMPYF